MRYLWLNYPFMSTTCRYLGEKLQMTNINSREIHLVRRPVGLPQAEDFACIDASLGEPAEGQILVRNIFMSVDPYMRGRMIDRKSYAPPFALNEAMSGGTVGEVIESRDPKHPVGSYVSHMLGWREYALVNGNEAMALAAESGAPLQAFLGTLGMPGMTAYVGLLRIGELKEGDTVFVSAASGAVGAIVCQIAKIKNCTVIGSAGSDEKCQWLLDVAGIDKVINYKTCGDLTQALAKAAPDGIDVYFENVGGEHLQAAIQAMKPFGRIAMCGMIAQYNDTSETPGPNNLIQIVGKSLKIQGFIVGNHADMRNDFIRDMQSWISQGKITWQETIYEGVEKAPDAFMALFSGDNKGKMLVQLGPDPLG
jgi:NADPH-dependent curcumin reductase CurA